MSVNHIFCFCPTDGSIILKTPAVSVREGDKVVLYCQYWAGNPNQTTFYKNGAELITYNSSSSDRVIKMTIENVSQKDEGLYRCASRDRKMESPASWLSVRPDRGRLCGFIIFHDNVQHSAQFNNKTTINDVNYCLLGNVTSTDGTAASTSGKNIL